MIYGRGISRPRGCSSRNGATSALTGQTEWSGHSEQDEDALLLQKPFHIASKSLPRKASPLPHVIDPYQQEGQIRQQCSSLWSRKGQLKGVTVVDIFTKRDRGVEWVLSALYLLQ